MSKEIALKIKVDGKEVNVASTNIDLFKKNIEKLKEQLKLLGQRTEENGEQFDKLKGDIDALESSFKETNVTLDKTTTELNKNEAQIVDNESVTKSYASQIRSLQVELASLGDRTEQNGVQYDNLVEKIKDLSEKQEDMTFGTMKLDDALSNIPGPIGDAANSFKMLDGGLKGARSAMASLTKMFPILKNAIVATGIGALVIVFGALVGVVIKAFNSFKPLQDAVGKLGVAFKLVGDLLQPLIDLIGKGLTIAVEGFAKAIALVTGNLDEYNEALAETKATQDFIDNSENRIRQMEIEVLKLEGKEKELMELQIEYEKKKYENVKKAQEDLAKLREEEGYKKDQVQTDRYYRESYRLERNYYEEKYALKKKYEKDKQEINKKYGDKQTEEEKRKYEESLQREREYQDRLRSLKQEQVILQLNDEYEISKKRLEQQFENQKIEISRLEISASRKKELLLETEKIYNLESKKLLDEHNEDVKKSNEDLIKQTRDIRTSLIKDEKERSIEEAKNRRDDALKSIEDTKAEETLKQEAKKQILLQYDKEIEDIEKGIFDKRMERIMSQGQFEVETQQIILQTKLDYINKYYKTEAEQVKQAGLLQIDNLKLQRQREIEDLNVQLGQKTILQEEYNKRVQALDEYYSNAILQNNLNTAAQIIESKMNMVMAINGLVAQTGQFLAEIAGENKKLAIAAVIVEKASAVAQVVAQTAIANAKAVAAFPLTAGQPWVTINTISGALSIATLIAASVKAISEINSSKNESSTSKSGSSVPNYGKNYGEGGIINGKSHAQGGVAITAEGGESIINRNSTTMFLPLLSAINKMGGGRSFDRLNKSTFDNPIVKTPKVEPMIVKTYVVSTDMTKEQEKYSRLKDLSTI